jgi:serine/threonine-protein kinase
MESFLAGGAFAAVYAVWDLHMRRRVAMKVYPTSARMIPLDEARLQGTVQHPNIMPLYDQCVDPLLEITGLVMPLFPGCDLQVLLDTHGPLPFRTALLCLDQICSAVDYLWARRQVAHGDIKPGNIWVTQSGAALLMDFNVPGQAIRFPDCSFGTPGFTAPEVFQGQSDARSDVFSLGCLLYTCLTGVPPFANDIDAGKGRYVPPTRIRPEILPALATVIDHALNVDPETRYQSARELRSALRTHRYRSGTAAGRYGHFIWDMTVSLCEVTWHCLRLAGRLCWHVLRYALYRPKDALILGSILAILLWWWHRDLLRLWQHYRFPAVLVAGILLGTLCVSRFLHRRKFR